MIGEAEVTYPSVGVDKLGIAPLTCDGHGDSLIIAIFGRHFDLLLETLLLPFLQMFLPQTTCPSGMLLDHHLNPPCQLSCLY